jgi:hypothetical protein
MKSTVFVRPNLKIFVLGAVLLALLHHLITNGHSQGQGSSKPLPVNAREMTEDELQTLVRGAAVKPSAQIYTRISRCYESRGEYKKALRYLRRAEKISQSEDNPD